LFIAIQALIEQKPSKPRSIVETPTLRRWTTRPMVLSSSLEPSQRRLRAVVQINGIARNLDLCLKEPIKALLRRWPRDASETV
jgi:hypothetical protein